MNVRKRHNDFSPGSCARELKRTRSNDKLQTYYKKEKNELVISRLGRYLSK